MSHITKLELEIEDLDALEEACTEDLGVELVRNQTKYKHYQRSQQGECEHAIRVKDNEKAFEIGVVRRGEKYELLNLYGQQGLVSEVIAQHYTATQRVMDTAEAADRAEKYLEELVQKASKTKKFGATVPQQEVKPAQVAQPRTLSNDLAASSPSIINSAPSEADRIKRALAALDRAGK